MCWGKKVQPSTLGQTPVLGCPLFSPCSAQKAALTRTQPGPPSSTVPFILLVYKANIGLPLDFSYGQTVHWVPQPQEIIQSQQ